MESKKVELVAVYLQKCRQIVEQGGLGIGVKAFCNQRCVLEELMVNR